MSKATLCLVLFLLAAIPAAATVVVEIHDRPLVDRHRAASAAAPTPAASPAGENRSLTAGGNLPADAFWFLPLYRVDRTSFGDTTLWSARNESDLTVSLTVQYYDVFFTLQRTESFDLDPNEVLPVNIRDIPGLGVDPDGFARGFVRISPTGPISVDVFQVDTSENFASADTAFVTDDFCSEWQSRFLSFGPGQGSVFSFLVNGPRGAAGGPPTIMGDVYNEQGAFLNSFTIRTDEWVFDVEILDFVLGPTSFGSVELTIRALFSPAGFLTVAHSAEGRFSVGLRGVCKDSP